MDMKKALILLVFLFLFSGGAAFAQKPGNPARLIKRGQFDVGFQWNSVFKQGFEDYDLKRTYSDGYKNTSIKGADFENDQYYMATITYGIFDRINVFARLGMVDGGKWLDCQACNNWRGDLESNFVWAIGTKGKLYEFDNGLGFGLAAQYMRYDNRKVKNWRSLETGETATDLGWATDDKLDYWQFDLMVNAYWTFAAFTPYVGSGYTYYDVSFNGRWTHEIPFYGWIDYDASFNNENKFTALAGVDMDMGKNFKANIQGTFVSSTALTLGITYCF
jgi:outer membrane protein W